MQWQVSSRHHHLKLYILLFIKNSFSPSQESKLKCFFHLKKVVSPEKTRLGYAVPSCLTIAKKFDVKFFVSRLQLVFHHAHITLMLMGLISPSNENKKPGDFHVDRKRLRMSTIINSLCVSFFFVFTTFFYVALIYLFICWKYPYRR